MKRYNYLFAILFSLLAIGCSEDYLETAPTASVTEEDMLSSLTGAETVLDGINRATYYFYGEHDRFGQKSIDYILDCLSDDFYPTERGYGWFVGWYQWLEHRNANSGNLEYVWAYYYDIINNANLVIKNVEAMTFEADADIDKQKNLLAQAYTYRGYSLYYLVQLFGEGTNGVPVPTEPNPDPLARASVNEVYQQIFDDLTKATGLFNDGGSNVSRKNVSQINVDVTNAVLARVSLTRGTITNDNALLQDAIDYATAVANNYDLNWGADAWDKFNDVGMWSKANSEWVWGAVLIDEQQTSYASFFSHNDPFFGGYSTLGNHHIMPSDLYDFLPMTDIRKIVNTPAAVFPASLVVAYFGGKARSSFKFTGFGEWTNDYLYIKAGEMYLIIAEAAARLGQDGLAQNAINTLNADRSAFGPYVPITLTGEELLDEILMYRRAELWSDGQRFLDMKRLGIGNEGRTAEQAMRENTHTIPAGDHRFNFLIPKQEIDANPLMIQNQL